jgi:hypothetical protein
LRFTLALVAFALAGCAGGKLVPGQSTAQDVEAAMGRPAEKHQYSNGEVVYFYPQLPYGRVTYAARIAPDGRLIAFDQRLTEANIHRVVRGQSRAEDVRDLLGPPYQPVVTHQSERETWTYPMRIAADPTPKWFVVQISPDGVVRETYLMDDPDAVPRGGSRRR